MLKVVHVLENFLPYSKAGTEQFVYKLSKELILNNVVVSIICTTTDQNIEEYVYNEIKVFRLPVNFVADKDELIGKRASSNLNAFVEIINSIKPTIIHFHTFNRKFNFFHLIKAKELGYKTAFTSHLASIFCLKGDLLLYGKYLCNGKIEKSRCLSCYINSKGLAKPISIILASSLNFASKFNKHLPLVSYVEYRYKELLSLKTHCDLIISLSDWAQKCYELNYVNNSYLLGQATDQTFEKKIYSKDKKTISIGFVGRMNPIKGIHLLLEALCSIDNSRFSLTIIYLPFDPLYLQKILKISEKLSNKCNFLCDLNADEIGNQLNNLDVLCLPSTIVEMAPLVILEAFAKGIPVIGSNIGGINDLVKDNVNGLLFDNNSVESLKSCLNKILNEPNLLSTLNTNITKPHSFIELSKKLIRLYKKIS